MKNKPYSSFGVLTGLAVALVLLMFVPACLDPIAWSPDGRYIAFAMGEDQVLQLWDSQTRTIRAFESIREVISCRFLPHGEEILFLADKALMTMSIETGDIKTVATGLEEDNAMIYDTSRNGKYLYYIKGKDGSGDQLLQKRLWHPSQERILYTSEEDILFPAINPDETRLLFSTGDDDASQLRILNLPDGSINLVQSNNERMFVWNQWAGTGRLVYVLWDDDEEKGTFCIYDLSSGRETPLCDSVSMYRPSFDAAHNRAALTRTLDVDRELYEIVVVHLDTGEVLRPVHDGTGTCFPVFSPCGNKLAYLEGDVTGDTDTVEYTRLKTITLETSEIATIYDAQRDS